MVMFELGRDPHNPELSKKLHELIARLGRERHVLFDPGRGRGYAIDSIAAPVYDADGAFVAGFALLGFDEPLDGAEVKRLASEVMTTAAEITSASRGHPPAA
jgi:DNA-binding IclR family transcriptional regulator